MNGFKVSFSQKTFSDTGQRQLCGSGYTAFPTSSTYPSNQLVNSVARSQSPHQSP